MYAKKFLIMLFIAGGLFGINLPARADEPIKTTLSDPALKSVIKGKIIEKDSKAPMEYANISIYKTADSSLVTGGITNQNGEFSIGKLDNGSYYVEANFIGFNKTRIKNISINNNHSSIDLGTIPLEASHQELGSVEVVAERPRVEYKVDKKVINVEQDINATGGTAVDVLENTPSVQVDIEGNVTLRGSSSFTVFIDGRPSALTGSDALQQIPASALQNIEIITNPSAKYDPDGMAGIINLVTKKNALTGFDGIVNVSGSTNESRSLDFTVNHKNEKRQFTLGFDTNNRKFNGDHESSRETYYDDRTEYLDTDGDREFNRHGYRFKGGLDLYLTDKTTLGFTANAGTHNRDNNSSVNNYYRTAINNPAGLTEKYTHEFDDSKSKNNFVDASINFLHKYNEDATHKLEGMIYFRNRTGDDVDYQSEVVTDPNYAWGDDPLYDLRVRTSEGEDSQDYRAKLDYTRPLGETGKLEAGFQSRMRRETEDYLFENYEDGSWINDPNYSSKMDFQRDIHAIYSTYSNKIDKLELMAGLRGEYTKREIKHIGENTENYKIDRFDWFPSVHASYDLLTNTQLMASYSRRINRPRGWNLDPFETFMNQTTLRKGNPGLKPEYTNSYDMSLMQRFGTSFISLDAFHRKTTDVISRITEVRDDGMYVLTSANVSQDKSTGAELMLNLNLTKWLLLNSSVSVYNYQLQGEVLGEYINRSSTNTDGRVNATFKFSTTSRMQITGMYRGPSVSTQGDREGSFYSNISYRQEFMNRKLTATLSVNDILGSGGWEGTNNGSNFNSRFKFKHEPRVVQLSLSFKLNNYKTDRKGNGDETNEMEFEGGAF
ncbi:TonB-dependent receptor domain-containing protein [Mangrovibacterium marinum]|uniref:Outer membrane receptor protein involved in Fe transport n=1 Tax=Mangrovibacterium marinum TaxID=1639118 RepID=A0A2T5BZH6_9BACT|nr:TonB-dependent receptor [Mangrovibacterium marinum]PTN07678.1 outer membrane receptor protein involved in Fe transport [Mangrovibacterium marinum]